MEATTKARRTSGRRFISGDGWVMIEYETGPDGIPTKFRFGRFVINLFLNFVHFVLWFFCLWLLLRFQWSHALLLAAVFWLVFALLVWPVLQDRVRRATAATTTAARLAVGPGVALGGRSAWPRDGRYRSSGRRRRMEWWWSTESVSRRRCGTRRPRPA